MIRDPEMYNCMRQALETVRERGIGHRHTLAMSGDNVTENEVKGIAAERQELRRLSDDVLYR